LHDTTIDRKWSDYIYRLLLTPSLLRSDPQNKLVPIQQELVQYELLKYPNEPTSADRHVDYVPQVEPFIEFTSNGVVCIIQTLEDNLDVVWKHKVIFTFKNTLEIPIQLRLIFEPEKTTIEDGSGRLAAPTHDVPKSVVFRRLGGLQTCDAATQHRHRDRNHWVVSHYSWKWEPDNSTASSVVGPHTAQSTTTAATIDNANIQVVNDDVVVVTNPVAHVYADQVAEAARNRPLKSARPRSNSASNQTTTAASSGNGMVVADSDKVQQLCGMGFSEERAKDALVTYNNNVESACNHLLGM
jgi:hypothetical protein